MTLRASTARRSVRQAQGRPVFAPTLGRTSATRSALLFGTALGVSIAIVAASPNRAWAADECGADVASVAICTATSGAGNPYPAGIDYVADAGEDITVILIGGGPATAVNVVTATDDGVTATGVATYAATVNTYVGSSIDAVLDGIEVYSNGGDSTVDNYANIYAGESGIDVNSVGLNGDTYITNNGLITVDGNDSANTFANGIYAVSGETVIVDNYGDIAVTSSSDTSGITGIFGYSFGAGVYIYNNADIDVTNTAAGGYATGIDASGDGVILVNSQDYMFVNASGEATGIEVDSSLGNAYVYSDGVNVESYGGEAFGFDINAAAGEAHLTVTGNIYTDVDTFSDNTGILIYGYDYAEVDVTGNIILSDGDDVTGIDAESYDGDVNVNVTGDIYVGDYFGNIGTIYATGIDAYSYNGDAIVTVTGNVTASGDADATGIAAESWNNDVYVTVTGDVTAYANDDAATGIFAYSYFYTADVEVTGNVSATGQNTVYGIYAYGDEGVEVDVTGNVTATSTDGLATGIYGYAFDGDVNIAVTGTVDAASTYGDAIGIDVLADDSADVTVTGSVDVDSGFAFGPGGGDATGVSAIGVDEAATVTVTGSVSVFGYDYATGVYADAFTDATVTVGSNGLFDGVFVTAWYDDGVGIDVYAETGDATVDVNGAVSVYGFDNAIGIEADAFDTADVYVSGNVSVEGALESAVGIDAYSSDGDVYVDVNGSITVDGDDNATGILAQGDDFVEIDAGAVSVDANTLNATGIDAYSVGGSVNIQVVGDMVVTADDNATGIEADTLAGGVTVEFAGNMDVTATNYFATGVDIESQASATLLVTGGGTIDVTAGYDASGIEIDSYGGEAGANITGNVYATSPTEGAYGIDIEGAFGAYLTLVGNVDAEADGNSGFGNQAIGIDLDSGTNATATITGDVIADSYNDAATGIDVDADDVATVTLTGDVYAYGSDDVFGINVNAGGNATVSVTGYIYADADDYDGAYGDVWGIYAFSDTGIARVTIDGTVAAFDGVNATGIEAEGLSVVIDGGGDVTVGDAAGLGIGVLATADFGDIYISLNDVSVSSNTPGGGGILAYGDYDIQVFANSVSTNEDFAEGILIDGNVFNAPLNAYVEVVNVTTLGDDSEGIQVQAYDAYVDVTGLVSTSGDRSDGINVDALDDAYVNALNVTTLGADADGVDVYAVSDIVMLSAGTISTSGFSSYGVHLESGEGSASATVFNVNTAGTSSDAVLVDADLNASIVATGTISTVGNYSDGLDAIAYLGDATITNSADVTTTGNYSNAVEAGSYNGNVTITNSGDLTTSGLRSYGIYGYTINAGSGNVDITNTGEITTSGDFGYGIRAIAVDGVATVDHTGTITTSGDNADGIHAEGYDGVNIYNADLTVITSGYSAVGIYGFSATGYVYIDSGTVITSGNSSPGIVGDSNGVDAGDYVTIYSDYVTTTGTASAGITGRAVAGDVTIGSFDVYTDGDNSDGIYGYSFSGDVDITSSFVETNGLDSEGIWADAFFGQAFVDSFDVDTDGDGSDGIYAYGWTGSYVESTYVNTGGASAYGIHALAPNGFVEVDSFDVRTYGDGSTGIRADGYDGVNVYSSFVYTAGDSADGIEATSTGGSHVYVSSFSVVTRGDFSTGITVDSRAVGTEIGSAYVASSFVNTDGFNAYGIDVYTVGGDATVNSFSVATYGDFSTGIEVDAYGFNDGVLNHVGDATVVASGVYTAGTGSTGIDARAQGGNVDIDVSSVLTRGDNADGIRAYAGYYSAGYSGNVYIEAANVYTYGDGSDGIYAFARGGSVQIFADDVAVYGLGADAIYAGTEGLDPLNRDVYIETTGFIYSFDGVGIAVDSAGVATIDIDSGSVYGYDWGIQADSSFGTYIDNDGYVYGGEGRAIDIDGAAGEIFNGGVILGFMDLTDNGDYVYNNGLWEAYGTSSFGLGVDEVVNEGTVGFSRYTGAAATTTFTGLEFFSNYSSISGVDQQVNDQLTMTGTAFFGGAGSEFDFDVQLGGPGSLADRLVIGSASGVTTLDPNDLLAGNPGVLNLGGILVVDSANAAEVGTEFVMDSVDKGWVEYELFFDAANDNWLIVGLPDDEVFELLAAISGAQDFWRRSGDAVEARWAEMRDASPSGSMASGPGGMGRSDGWELWMQSNVGDEEFENTETFVIGGFTFVQDLEMDNEYRGFQFGFDNLTGNTMWGLTMGFAQQETNLTATSNSFDFEGWNIGAYAGWASNGFFLNGLVKGDFFSVDGNFHTIPTMFEFDGVTWGAKGEIGYRWEGEQMFFEPLASLTWTTTELDSFSVLGATTDFGDSDSLRAKAGARIGGTFGSGNVVWTPYIGAYWIDELEGDNGLTFTTGPVSIDFAESARDAYGQLDFGVTAQTFYGLEGFIKGEWNFGDEASGGGLRMGARWRW